MRNPLRNYIEKVVQADIDKFHLIFGLNIAATEEKLVRLEREIKILKCDNHMWEAFDHSLVSKYEALGLPVSVICTKCGKYDSMLAEDLEAHKLDKALDEVERLGGEVER